MTWKATGELCGGEILTGSRFCEELSVGDEVPASFNGINGVDYEAEVGAAWREMRETWKGEREDIWYQWLWFDGVDRCGSLFLECEKERLRERGERGGEISNKEVKR